MALAIHTYRSETPILPVDAFRYFPTLAQDHGYKTCSPKYAHISTRDIIERLDGAGFDLHAVTIAKTRLDDKQDFAKHLLRWRYRGTNAFNNGTAFEVIGMNSHDKSRAFTLAAGATVFACLNGIVAGSLFERFKVNHSNNAASKVIEGTYRVIEQGPVLADTFETMRAKQLTREAQEDFAGRALALRYPDASTAPVTSSALLIAKREADNNNSLWATFNKAQEHLIRGGMRGLHRLENGRTRMRSVRAVTGIDQSVKLNSQLFDLALEYAN